MKKTLSIMLAVFMLLAIAAGCAKEPPVTSPDPDPVVTEPAETTEPTPEEPTPVDPASIVANLTLYTSEPEELATEMIADFNEIYPNVKIEIFRSGTGNVTAKIDTELETGSTEANIIWFADIGYVKGMDDKGLIYHYSPEAAANFSPEYAYNDGMGHEVRLIYNVLAYNTTVIGEADAPKDWNDVTGPAFKSKFAMANPNYSGGAFTALVVHVQHEDKVGWTFYENASANDCKYEQSNGNLQTKVSNGEYGAVAIVDFMARNAKAEGSPVEVVYPASGAVLIPTPLAIVNNIPEDQIDGAKAFVDYMFTEQAQKLFIAQGYIPVMPEAGVPEGAPSAADVVTMPFDLDYYVANSSEIRSTYVEKFGE